MKFKRKSFGKIWAGIAIPFIALSAVVTFFVFGLVMVSYTEFRLLTNVINAGQLADLLGMSLSEGQLSEEDLEKLQLEVYDMVVIVCAPNGEEIARSNIDRYSDSDVISREIYADMLLRLEEDAISRFFTWTFSSIDPFGYNYMYGQINVNTGGESYTLKYATVCARWLENRTDFCLSAIILLFFLILFSLLPAEYYYKIYRERTLMEDYYRSTAGALAHDLKTPLAAISGYAENLRENVHTEKRDYYAESVLKNVDNMNSIIESVLELAKLENLSVALHMEKVDLRELTETVLEQYQEQISEKGLDLSLQGELVTSADKLLMKRALENLIGNAVKYTPDRHEIRIQMTGRQYEITNTGVSMNKEQRRESWKVFVKGESARSNVTGTGIGLTIVEQIMTLHSFAYRMSSDSNSVSVVFKVKKHIKKS